MKKKITILGGAGFIGHNLALFLKKKGFQIQVIDSLGVNNLKSKKYVNISSKKIYKKVLNERLSLLRKNKIKLIELDLRKFETVKKKLDSFKPDFIIHLAAVSHANISNKDPQYTFDHSFITLMNTLNFCKDFKKVHLLYFSSSMVYGEFMGKKVTENMNCKPIGIYGNLKLSGEMMVKSFSKIFRFPYTIIRPSALYGERCVSRRVGQIFIENALQNKNIEINGNGKEKLDFTYIDDLISGIYKILVNKKSINETFNITYGNGRAISDLTVILKKNFSKINIKFKEREKFTPKRGGLSIIKAKKLIGYRPKYSIEKGYQKYIDWYKSFFYKNLN